MARRKSLSDRMVASLKPTAKRQTIADPELAGHFVRVSIRGVKSYVCATRDPTGKQVWAGIGSCDTLPIAEARERARVVLQRIKDGQPAVEAVPEKPATFAEVAAEYLKRHVHGKQLRSAFEIERCLNVYILPKWAARDFVEIRRSDVAALLDHVEDNHGRRMADVVLGVVRGSMFFFARRADDYSPPLIPGMGRDPRVARSRVLDDAEIRALWAAAEDFGAYGGLVRLALLTCQRRAPLAQMQWADLSGEFWAMPNERRRKGNAGRLQLPALALDIIDEQPRVAGNSYVFTGRGAGHFARHSRQKELFDAELLQRGEAFEPWVLHDLRRTGRTLLARANVRPDVAERLMGHAPGRIEATYDRHGYEPQMADALRRLAGEIETVLRPPADNVTPIRGEV